MQDLKNIKINPGFKTGTVEIPPSKSISHRALICAGLATSGESHVKNIILSDDITATIDALRQIGLCRGGVFPPLNPITYFFEGGKFCLDSIQGGRTPPLRIDCKESGSTLRFLIPVAVALGITATFTGEGKLPERPVSLYQDLFADKNVSMQFDNGKLPVTVSGKLSSGKFYIPGNISSQFITGLMLALPILDGDSEIILTSPLESKSYVDITVDVLERFGVKINEVPNGYYINGNQNYTGVDYTVEGDFSQAAFFACIGVLNGDITLKNLNQKSLQGDKKFIEILNDFGAKVYFDGEDLMAVKCENLTGIKIDASQIPDLIPVLSVVGAYANGETAIYNAGRLRLKESDRINAICEMLKLIGADVKETDDGMIINGTGGEKLPGGFVKSFSDHRIAMSAAVASVWTENGVIIDDMTCINKSYPMFLKDFEGLNS